MPNVTAHTRAAAPICLLLLLVVCLTRPQTLATWSHMPDATVAVFLLAGCYLRRGLLFALFFSLVVLIDTLVVRLAGQGDHCITLAYCFLLPAYAAPWWLGCLLAAQAGPPAARPVWLLAPLLAGLLAFLFSDGGFWFWSGHFQGGWSEYPTHFSRFAPNYLLASWVGSLVLGLMTECLRRSWPDIWPWHRTAAQRQDPGC